MKKLLFLLSLAAFALAFNLTAQPPSAEEMAKRETESMKAELKLTPEQLTSVEAINLKYAKIRSEMFQQGQGGDFEQMRKTMEENQKQKRAELEKVLTADQLKSYDVMMENRRRNMQGPPR
jgi:hypothetical protein